ncbi:MAG: fumarylacetoacetate hydrolase family protein [Trebonia sp.]
MTTWCRFEDSGEGVYGLVSDGVVTAVTGNPLRGYAESNRRIPLAGLRLLPPVIPNTFFCAGLNYRAHAQRMAYGGHAPGGTGRVVRGGAPGPRVRPVPERPEIGYRANSALTGHLSPIVRPADCTEPLVAEGELVAVIGRLLRHVTPEEARDGTFGWTIGNDVSARGWQRSDRTFWRCKNSDTFKPMGPFIVTDADPLLSTTTVRVDGSVRASFPTGDMLFGPYEYISAISRYITLSPGDVVWLGTDETATVVPGQLVEVTIDGIGTLANPVIEETLPGVPGVVPREIRY